MAHISRRGFLGLLAAAAVGAAVPEPVRTYFLPPAGGWRPAEDRRLGITMRMMEEFDAKSGLFVSRMDVLYGMSVFRPDLAVRVVG